MSRTFRRKNQEHEYIWVLKDWDLIIKGSPSIQLDRNSLAGRKAIAIFHSDVEVTMRSSAPRWYRKEFDHRRRTRNKSQMKLWLEGRVDPVIEVRHKHDANGSWW